jgi:hypothetical protein
MNGFQLLSLADYHGEGLSLVGCVTPHWHPRRYDDPARFRRFCSPLVLLARFDRHVWTRDETFRAEVQVANFTERPCEGCTLEWELSCAGKAVSRGALPPTAIALGTAQPVGTLSASLAGVPVPCRLDLRLRLVDGAGRERAAGDWPLWCYPDESPPAPEGVEVAVAWTADLADRLAAGARILFAPDPAAWTDAVPTSFAPMFWSSYWTREAMPRTLGLLVQSGHPALEMFPTEDWSDWQWHGIVTGARALVLDDLAEADPVVEVIDDYFRAHRLGLITEFQVGAGRIMICGCDLRGDLSDRPAARHLRDCLVRYLAGDALAPAPKIAIEDLAAMASRGGIGR